MEFNHTEIDKSEAPCLFIPNHILLIKVIVAHYCPAEANLFQERHDFLLQIELILNQRNFGVWIGPSLLLHLRVSFLQHDFKRRTKMKLKAFKVIFELDTGHLVLDRVKTGDFPSCFVQELVRQHQFAGHGVPLSKTVNEPVLAGKE